MPTSALPVWPTLVHLCWDVAPRRILDVGPGHGKAGILLREYIGTTARGNGPIEAVDAIEAEPRYLGLFPWLPAVYDEVHRGDIVDQPADLLAGYDLVLFADSIEHIDKDAAVDLLDRCPGWVVISTPVEFFQNPEADEWPSEMHRSAWTADDFHATGRVDHLEETLGGWLVRLRPKET